MRAVFENRVEDKALSAEVDMMVSVPVIPALKQAMAATTGIKAWGNVRPPLRRLEGQARAAISEMFAEEHSA